MRRGARAFARWILRAAAAFSKRALLSGFPWFSRNVLGISAAAPFVTAREPVSGTARRPPTSSGDSPPSERALQDFYQSWEWQTVRYKFLLGKQRVCMCCNRRTLDVGGGTHVDHIKPVRTNWSLRLDSSNLQILCAQCNRGKGSWDQTDWRPGG
jgi:hypothetical protein